MLYGTINGGNEKSFSTKYNLNYNDEYGIEHKNTITT